jgi:thiamine biosynthesis protein ThiI
MTSAAGEGAIFVREISVHHAEIGLKGGNRTQFERRLGDRLREALANANLVARVGYENRRHRVTLEDPSRTDRALQVLARVPGVAHVAPVVCVPRDLDRVREAAVAELAAAAPGSFKVESRRGDKSFPMTSIELSQAVAPACVERSGRRVDVHDPDVTVNLDVLADRVCVSARRVKGPGGLPVGSTSRLLSFLSGGLDSAVATWAMLRRGARVTAVHFHNRSHQGTAVIEKLEDLCTILAWAAGEMPLAIVPFEACQRAIVGACPAELRMIVYRRAMFRIASRLAAEEHALGYVTGDSLGQVASQTAENLLVIHEAADLPVYAPLIGTDKVEIVALARRIGTFDVSIRPHADCCSFLIAPHPATKSDLAQVLRIEEGIPFDALVEEAAAGVERRSFRPDPAW